MTPWTLAFAGLGPVELGVVLAVALLLFVLRRRIR